MGRLILICFFICFSLECWTQTNIEKLQINPAVPLSCTNVKDQSMSSTCWSFASNSFIESELLRMGNREFDLSEMFTARLAYLQKIKTHLQTGGQNFFTPGGQFHDVQWVLKNFGIVPEEVYNGKPRGEYSHNHQILDTLMSFKLKSMLAKGKKEPDSLDWNYINNCLDKYLGKLPVTFKFEEHSFTPVDFMKKVLKINPDDYIEITSYSHHPWYKPFVLENKYNWMAAEYMNVPLADFLRITNEALKNGYSVLWNGDVSDSGFNFNNDLASLPGVIKNLADERQKAFSDSSSYLDHVMHIVGRTTDSKGGYWYYIKNSWGTFNNKERGFLYMDENYFAMKTAAIIVHKEAIPAAIKVKMGL